MPDFGGRRSAASLPFGSRAARRQKLLLALVGRENHFFNLLKFTNLTRRTEIGANSYYLEAAGQRLVLDCGMHPEGGRRRGLAKPSGARRSCARCHRHLPLASRSHRDAAGLDATAARRAHFHDGGDGGNRERASAQFRQRHDAAARGDRRLDLSALHPQGNRSGDGSLAMVSDGPAVHAGGRAREAARGGRRHTRVRRCRSRPGSGRSDPAGGGPHGLLHRRRELRRSDDHAAAPRFSGIRGRCADHRDDAWRQPIARRFHARRRGAAAGRSDQSRLRSWRLYS